MSNFTVNPPKLKSTAQDLENSYNKLKNYGSNVEAVKNKLASQSAFSAVIKTLDTVYEQILDSATKANNMHKALEMIAQEYISCESTICDIPSDKRNLFQKILAALNVGDERYQDSAYYDTSQEEEYAQDCYMKEQIAALLAQSQYSEAAWNAADADGRKQMLNDFMNDVAEIYGVDINTTINFTNTPPSGGTINYGSYTNSKQRININEYIINNRSNSYDLMNTVVHELRHAYQHQAVEHPEKFIVTQETLDRWECNFDNYVSSGDDFDLYREQGVEIDARDLESLKY
jgi:hypothetical protein